MIWENVELHNVAEVTQTEAGDGVRLLRIPESVRARLNPRAQTSMLGASGVEIRFVSRGPTARVSLSCEEPTRVSVFHGVYQSRDRHLIDGERRSFDVRIPETILRLPGESSLGLAFRHDVVRVLPHAPIDRPLVFHGVEGDGIGPPPAGHLPAVRYLAYGTSITQGIAATGPHLSFAAHAARRLGLDLINLGVAGAAHCEPELAEYIAGRDDWHIATLELSVNMIGAGFTPDEFSSRVAYMVNAMTSTHPDRPILCMSIFPHFRDLGASWRQPGDRGTAKEFRRRLREVVESCGLDRVRLIEGPEMLPELSGLTADLLHPSDAGMITIGENLARAMKESEWSS